ncbi:DEAD/DEAH box helicase [Bacillus sp. FJAT-45037]|uniref:DEAD/DEAH box helicase n=1 Tax=Bacillus sp. FJAT-45037 TaxID=2011007 RepID=UPI0012FE63CA|nr:DEAD/DEAH box helicase [Bacillus sp. FJAT-45037]
MSIDTPLFMNGKRLLRTEIPYSDDIMDSLLRENVIAQTPSVLIQKGKPLCVRCGNEDRTLFASHHCARCHRHCLYCRHCIRLGKTQECRPLYYLNDTHHLSYPLITNTLSWNGQLSPAQEKASNAVVRAISDQLSVLLWAVCGAGKTEMLFKGIEHALSLGKRILLATPRVDVVKELTPRLKEVFPNVPLASLYGGSKEDVPNAQLVIATTHQVMRFYRTFDVTIVDEVDAFPFSYDKSLQHAVEQAKRIDSSLIYLTATPSTSLKKQPNLETVYVPRRYHGYPLPVPTFTWCGNWRKSLQKKLLPPNVLAWIHDRLTIKKPTLVFVPSIDVLEQCSVILNQVSITHEAIHAADPHRHDKLTAFKQGEYSLLLTTTILERGVTIKGVDVAVLGAEDDVFTEAALVQMAGRVGRKVDAPDGAVCFFHYGKTVAMNAAKSQIKRMNRMEV